MGVITTGQTFASGDQVTSTKLNDIANQATFTSAADTTDNATLTVSGGKLKVKDNGIGSTQLASDASVDANRAVETNHIKDLQVTTAKLAADSVEFAKMQNISTAKVIGRTTAGSGDPEEVDLLDEDNMASDSNTSLATQQSIKAYVDDSISSGPQIFAFSSGSITTQAQHTVSYPAGWTHGLPDKVLVSTRYPTGDGSSQTWFQVVSFDETSVTVYSQTQNVSSFTAVIADLLLVKN